MLRSNRKWVFSLILTCALLFSLSGCMNMKVVARYDSDNPVAQRVTKTNFLWGLVQPKDVRTATTCESICQVVAKRNIGQILLSGITLGIVVPMTIEYECCAFEPQPSEL